MKNIISALIVAGVTAALPSINKLVLAILFTRISSIICIISVVFIITIYIQSIGSGICNNGGLFQVTSILSLIPFNKDITFSAVCTNDGLIKPLINKGFHTSIILSANSKTLDTTGPKLDSDQIEELLNGYAELKKNSEPKTVSEYLPETNSSFSEAFPNFNHFKLKDALDPINSDTTVESESNSNVVIYEEGKLTIDVAKAGLKIEKIRQFLQGDEPNLIGTVLGFTKRVTKYIENNQKKVLHDSFLIYFDHISGLISRHLINRGLIDNNYQLIIDDKVKIPTIYNKTFVLSEEEISQYLKYCLENYDYNNRNCYEDLNKIIHSISKNSNKDNSEIYEINTNKPLFDLLFDFTNRTSSTNIKGILSNNIIRKNYHETTYSGKLDSGFYSNFIDNLIKTYLAGYPNLNGICLYSTSILSWLEFLDYYRIRSLADTELEFNEKGFYYFNNKVQHNKTNRVMFSNYLYNYKEIENPIIRIPKVFYSSKNINHFNKTLSLYNPNIKFKIEPYTISNSPDAIKLLKNMINGNLFFTENELEKRINHFNYLMKKKYIQTELVTQNR